VVDITVAIACYDQGRFLAQAIQSALRQTIPPRAIIVVDDGSNDDTCEVANRFPQVRYVFQENAGLSTARNTGLAHSQSSHILFLDADDWLVPEALQLMSDAIRSTTPRPAFVHGGYLEVAEDGTPLATHFAQPSGEAFRSLLRGNHIAMHGTVLYDAALLRGAGGFDPRLGSCEDYDVYLRLARLHPIASYAGVSAHYRRHGSSLSRNRLTMIETALSVIDRHLAISEKTHEDIAAAREGRRAMIAYYVHQIAADVHVGASRWRACRAVLADVSRRPKLAFQLASWAIGRWTRAVTTTG
jgi:GT2 family glycosyltransferase